MTITYDNIQGASNLITFTDIPNILKIEDSDGGSYATLTLNFSGNLKSVTSGDSQWYITFLGETVSNVIDYNNAVNKGFYVSSSPASTAAYVAKAFRNCSNIAANFTVEHDGSQVELRARAVGSIWTGNANWFDTNITSTYMSSTASDGSANTDLNGARIMADVISNGNYVTTLEKIFYNGECAFNMSPLLTTLARHGETEPYQIKLSYLKDGEYNTISVIGDNYISVGYMVNQGNKFLDGGSFTVAQNYSRGKIKVTDNNSTLYVYGASIPISFYNGNTGGMTITTTYRNSALGEIATSTTTWRNSDASRKLWDITIPLSQVNLNRAFYVDIALGSTTIRYNVIKPLKATEYYQRIYWRNSYGGISFFDFTGQKSETRDVEISTYQKNIFNYYTSEKNELEKVYDNDVKYSVTLKSHLFEHDGKYIFNDLLQSSDVWTERNGEKYAVIIDSVSVEEQDRNDIYDATVKYHYSQEPSII